MIANVHSTHTRRQAQSAFSGMACTLGLADNASMKRTTLFIRARRKAKGMTQEDLAGVSGVERSVISRIETGKMGYTSATLESLADALDCSVADLFKDPDAGADIVSIWDHIPTESRDQARAVLQAFIQQRKPS